MADKLRTVNLQQKPEAEYVPTEVIAQSIAEISAAFKRVKAGRLNDRALELLVHAACKGTALSDVRSVLEVLPELERLYLRAPK
ncbi:MAG: hypothetical protein PHS14_07665 [Elusimicrobia bacterium]|nr:hypothetical protein [Elusimicrobiota bacterium]